METSKNAPIELPVVIGIITMLAAVLVPAIARLSTAAFYQQSLTNHKQKPHEHLPCFD